MNVPGPVQILPSKSGVPTLKIGQFLWHSGYDPVKEARLWASSLNLEKPYVLLVGEGLGYLKSALEELHPDKVLFTLAVHGQEDGVQTWGPQSPRTLEQFFLGFLTGKSASAFQTVVWPPAKNILPEWVKSVLQTWSGLLLEQEANSATFRGMGRKWIANALARAWKNPPVGVLEPTDSPVLLLASGPSAERCLTADLGNIFSVVALASSLKALQVRNLSADLFAMTDGGYWANRLLPEGKIPCIAPLGSVASNTECPWLAFTQGFHYETFILGADIVPSIPSRGTVAYSAITYLAHFFRGPIGIAGLDLVDTSGRPHLRPHPLDEWFWDDRLNTAESRFTGNNTLRSSQKIAQGSFQSSAHRLYARGLSEIAHPKLYRIEAGPVPLGNMAPLSLSEWTELCQNTPKTRVRITWRNLDLRSGALAWKHKIESSLRRQDPEESALAEVLRHLCTDSWENFQQKRWEKKGVAEAYRLLEKEFLLKWNQLWAKYTDS